MIARWAEEEFATIDLKDERRNRRAKIILTQLHSIGEGSPEAAKGTTSASLDALYRFMRSDAISPENLLAPHQDASVRRTRGRKRVALVQDTTEVDLTKPNRKVADAGPLSSNAKYGFYLHPLVAYSESGVPLGVVEFRQWTREKLDCSSSPGEKKKQRNAMPIEQKESYRWVEIIRRGKQIAEENPGTEYVGVSDSESDVQEVFGEVVSRPDNYQLLVRACQNRSVKRTAEDSETQYLREAVANSQVRFRATTHVRERTAMTGVEKRKRRTTRDAREAQLEVRTATVTLPVRIAASSLQKSQSHRDELTVNVVQVREIDPPEGEDPVDWILVTTMPIETDQQVHEVIDTYKLRWNIEVLFMTLKTGLGLEKLQYRTLDRYLNATMLLLVVAWRVQCVTKAGREEPEESCETYFDTFEWKPVWLVQYRGRPLPASPPSMGEFMILVATLGGYINRKQQGPPGVKTIWRGIRRLEDLAEAYKTFGFQTYGL